MLYELGDKGEHRKIQRTDLESIGWLEEDLENMLIKNIDDFISSRNLMPIFKERKFQEEPDIMAIDEKGDLYIFELKRWKAREENLLQVLRYGQIFGGSRYKELEKLYFKYTKKENVSLRENHKEYFGLEEGLKKTSFNSKQNFIVVTNGMDQKTIEAIEYWKSQGVKIDGLIYWVYTIGDRNFIEIDRYMPNKELLDYETNNYIINTNYNNYKKAHEEMLDRHIAAAYVSGWKEKIDRLQIRDRVFLYKSGEGIVAFGLVNSDRKTEDWKGVEQDKYYVDLINFIDISKDPISPARMRQLRGADYSFRTTMYSIDDETSKKLEEEVRLRSSQIKSLTDK